LNSIAPLQSGIGPVVGAAVHLELKLPDGAGQTPMVVQITRDSGSAATKRVWSVALSGAR